MRRLMMVTTGTLSLVSLVVFLGCFAMPGGTGLPGGASGNAAAGEAIFTDRGCASCHGADGSGGIGPSLANVDFTTLEMTLRNPATTHSGGLFADLTDQVLTNMLEFLVPGSTQTPGGGGTGGGGTGGGGSGGGGTGGGSVTNGGLIFLAEGCDTCHGSDGTNGFAPSLLSVTFATLHAKLRDMAVSHGGGKFSHLTDQDLTDLVSFFAPGSGSGGGTGGGTGGGGSGGGGSGGGGSGGGGSGGGGGTIPHTDKVGGVFHAPGKSNPIGRCDSCHGSDLRGSSFAPSCFQCHGKKWN